MYENDHKLLWCGPAGKAFAVLRIPDCGELFASTVELW